MAVVKMVSEMMAAGRDDDDSVTGGMDESGDTQMDSMDLPLKELNKRLERAETKLAA